MATTKFNFEEYCLKFELKDPTIEKLNTHKINDEDRLKKATDRDIRSLGLSMGQKIALKRAINYLKQGEKTSEIVTGVKNHDIASLQEHYKQMEQERKEDLKRYHDQLAIDVTQKSQDIFDNAMAESVVEFSETTTSTKVKRGHIAPVNWVLNKFGYSSEYEETTEETFSNPEGNVTYETTEKKVKAKIDAEKSKDDRNKGSTDKDKGKYITTKTVERKMQLKGAACFDPHLRAKMKSVK